MVAGPDGVVAVVGAGVVGTRLTRELLAHGTAPVALMTSRVERADVLAPSFAGEARILVSDDPMGELPRGTSTVVLCGEGGAQAQQASAALAAGCDVVAVTDDRDAVEALMALGPSAAAAGRRVVVGAAFSPGLSCVLASFVARNLDVVEEVHVARVGAGGRRCAAARRRDLRRGGREWRDGEWVSRGRGDGRELAWFPDPIGALDCYLVGTAEPTLLVDAWPGLQRAVVRVAASRSELAALLVTGLSVGGRDLASLPPEPVEGGVGAIRVEVRGSVGARRRTEVLACIDRPAVATSALVATVVEALRRTEGPAGAHGMAGWATRADWAEPSVLLRELRTRGVRVAAAAAE